MRNWTLCVFVSMTVLLGCVISKAGKPVPAGADSRSVAGCSTCPPAAHSEAPAPAIPSRQATNVTVTRLGSKTPELRKSDSAPQSITAIGMAPVVLWSTHGAPAVLYVSESTVRMREAGSHTQEFGVLDQGSFRFGGKDSPFPVVHTGLAGFTDPDGVKVLLVADLDGDGEDELVTIAQYGSVEAYAAARKVGSWKGRGRDFVHRPDSIQTARIAGKDIVHIAMEREQDRGDAARLFAVLRIDQHGITEVRLDNLASDDVRVRSVAAISHPGSHGLDEIAVASTRRYSNDLFFSRHDPDGRMLDAPRRASDRSSVPPWLVFLPQNDTFIAHDFAELLVVRPAASKDWLATMPAVRCNEADDKDKDRSFLGVMDPGQAPKLLARCGTKLVARDLNGRSLAWTDSGWKVAEGIKPFYSAPPPQAAQRLEDVLLEREGKAVLLVYTRKRGFRPLSVNEVESAAGRFLRPERRRALAPKELEAELTRRVADAGDLERDYLDIKGLTKWLASIDLPAQTTFVLIRDGRVVGQASIPGTPPVDHGDLPSYAPSIQWQLAANTVRIVLALGNGEETRTEYSAERPRPPLVDLATGFYLVEWALPY
jgi:hypothetical protein